MSTRVRNIVDKEIRSDLENVDGVASVNIYGGREKAIEIRLNPEACKALNLTPSSISGLLTQNTQDKAFVGFANEPDSKYFIHVNALYSKVSDLENIVVAPGPVLLKDVATVFFDLKEETSYSRVNGKDAVSVALMSDSQANLIDLSHRAVEAIDRLNEKLAYLEVEVVVQENTAETMENNIDQIINLALVGGLLAILILWLFLKNLRLVFFIALSIPISVYTAFNFFYAFGITINSLTLVGMALAIGMLLDNSVVVLENIYRLSASGLYARTFRYTGYKGGMAFYRGGYADDGDGLPSLRFLRQLYDQVDRASCRCLDYLYPDHLLVCCPAVHPDGNLPAAEEEKRAERLL